MLGETSSQKNAGSAASKNGNFIILKRGINPISRGIIIRRVKHATHVTLVVATMSGFKMLQNFSQRHRYSGTSRREYSESGLHLRCRESNYFVR